MEHPIMLRITEFVHRILREELPPTVPDPDVHRAGQQVARLVRLVIGLCHQASCSVLAGSKTSDEELEGLVRQYFPLPKE